MEATLIPQVRGNPDQCAKIIRTSITFVCGLCRLATVMQKNVRHWLLNPAAGALVGAVTEPGVRYPTAPQLGQQDEDYELMWSNSGVALRNV